MRRLPRPVRRLLTQVRHDRARTLGFPGSAGIDLTAYRPFLQAGPMLNNAGDPSVPGLYPAHSKQFELELLGQLAAVLGADGGGWRGYIASGASEGTEWALHTARRALPGAVVYTSTSTHFATVNVCDRLQLPLTTVPADGRGELRYPALQSAVDATRPAVVVAHAGTGMTEAVDDLDHIHAALDRAGVGRDSRWVHVDGALAAVPLALLDEPNRPACDFRAAATSIVTSGHKFFGVPVPCAAVLVDQAAIPEQPRVLRYTGSVDSTVSCSRSGLAVLWWWHIVNQVGWSGLARWAADARSLARYTEHTLRDAGWPAWRAHRHAFTVVLPTPDVAVLDRWPLAHDPTTGLAHVVCMPGLSQSTIDRFTAALGRYEDARLATQPGPLVAVPAVPADRHR